LRKKFAHCFLHGVRTLNIGPGHRRKIIFIRDGLDPGIDHMSAMQLIDRIHGDGGRIHSFRSHTGGLVSPESDDNPWHYKISWNPRNVVLAGNSGAVFKENNRVIRLSYEEVFEYCKQIEIEGLGKLAFYPNRDSLSYIPLYSLEESSTFIRTTLRYPAFCENWKYLVSAGLTNAKSELPSGLRSIKEWSAPILPFISESNKHYFEYLGLFDDLPIPKWAKTSADLLQSLLESRLRMQEEDKDMIVMLHEFEYESGNNTHSLQSSLVIKGNGRTQTAMAKRWACPLGIAAKLILEENYAHRTAYPYPTGNLCACAKELAIHGVRFLETLN
jgi:saccharopine dehydrogenase (NADP+, L-glutamate forming)